MSNKKKTSSPSGASTAPSRRQMLREQQEAAEAKRKRTMTAVVIGAVALALALAGIVGSQLWKKHQDDKAATAAQVTPPDASADRSGIVVKAGKKAADAPTLVVYQDYQCPACRDAEAQFGTIVNNLAAKGEIGLEYRTMTFLDTNFPKSKQSSLRAGMAAACADTISSEDYEKYHDTVYKHQSASEGAGYTDDQLTKDFPAEAGITGADLTKFQSCYSTQATRDFVKNTDKMATEAQIRTTPTYQVNGKKLDLTTVGSTEESFLAAVKQTATS